MTLVILTSRTFATKSRTCGTEAGPRDPSRELLAGGRELAGSRSMSR